MKTTRNNHTIPVLAFALATVLSGTAERRTQAEIYDAASHVLLKAHPGMKKSPVTSERLEILAATNEYTVVGFPTGAHAIVSNDDLLPEVLGYSAQSFSTESDCPGFRWWLSAISEAAQDIVKSGRPFLGVAPDPDLYPEAVGQMLTDQWGQLDPYNNRCPDEYDINGRLRGRSVVGCVATSASQVMRYHQYPPIGEGVHIDMQTTDAFDRPVPLKVDYSEYPFDYSKMRDTYYPGEYTEEEADEAAKLCYAAGVAFGMIYGTEFSGTYTDSCAVGLREHFGYKDAEMLDRRDYGTERWMNIIFRELSAKGPVLYAGADPFGKLGGGGHAFVFDGYDSEGKVHVNWGWYGRHDGYYEVSLLNPSTHSFSEQQSMIIGVVPPEYGDRSKTYFLSGEVRHADLAEAVAKSMNGEYGCLDLSNAVFPDNALPAQAFYNSGFSKIILPESLEKIGDGAFGFCRHLAEVIFPASNERQNFIVEDGIIYDKTRTEVISVLPYYCNDIRFCSDYHSLLTIPDGVEKIHPYAFDGCFRIKGVDIPASLKWIGRDAFRNMSCLRRVTLHTGNAPDTDPRAFTGMDPGFTQLYLPAGTSEIYLRAGIWKKFFTYDNVFEYGTNVKARNVVRLQGEPNPEFEYQVFGEYVFGEPELTCDATEESAPGEYVIKVGRGSLPEEDVVLTDGVLRIIGDNTSAATVSVGVDHGDVYSPDGRLVLKAGESLDNLEKGIYIVNGTKIKI